MSLHKPKNSSRWHYQFQVNGKRYTGTTGTANKTKALQVEREMRNKVHGQVFLGEAETITLEDALNKYVNARRSASYYKGMQGMARKICGYKLQPKTQQKIACYGLPGTTDLHDVQTKDIERLVQARKSERLSFETIKHEIGLIRSTINEMARLGFRVNKEINFPTLKTHSRLRYLDSEEEAALLRALDVNTQRSGIKRSEAWSAEMQRNLQDNYDLVVFLLDTGCRYSEAANIPWSAISVEKGTISLYRSKVGNEDMLYMPSRLRAVIERRANERRDGSRFVFENREGKARGYAVQAIRKAIDRAGLNRPDIVAEKGGKVSIHTLRHTFASKMVTNGVSLYQVSALLGHKDSKMTQRYAHLAPNDASRLAVQVLDGLQAA
ncbi:site-specific integrase [Herbaspirillum huttiense F1]|uniref:tyrosine-type recombinase/integrase n=1 Tax=Herbaspirillum TaxID=963 RepID=UPI00160343D9|nr:MULTISPECIES: site-specific integrase [Herbaspirillum]MDR6742026.1 integrase [Herbaspirillum sp. 1173]MDT0358290.1 site-specific integrase [Herbaspirillum huttiense F1]QNB05769.1 site-specific integrase [Herbaspirillum frisingense]